MGEINWTVTLFLGAMLSIPIGIFTNLITPLVKENIEKATLSTQNKKLDRLRKEYERANKLYQNTNLLVIEVGYAIINMLWGFVAAFGFISLGIAATENVVFPAFADNPTANGFSFFLLVMAFLIMFMYTFREAAESGTTIRRIRNFDKYQKDVLDKINKIDSQNRKINKEKKQ